MLSTYISLLKNRELDIFRKKDFNDIPFQFPILNKSQLYGMVCKYFSQAKEERKKQKISLFQSAENKYLAYFNTYIKK